MPQLLEIEGKGMRVHEINGEDICGTSLLDRAHRGWGVSLGSAGASPRRCPRRAAHAVPRARPRCLRPDQG